MTGPTNRTEFNRQLTRWAQTLPAAGQSKSWTEQHGPETTAHNWTLRVSDDGLEALLSATHDGLAVAYVRADVLS